ncbi:CheR family methyltransferase [Mesorhizobium sp. BAC0120]|uniref:CheR family methyltransferase n=1 Tax=Mesorhizobium sp. BAC0120 TaxID=3090670 RepID=UPI00298BE348|nr:CheR family methyltransferase [Mesorhizobium sp. BAC0120]MDW6020197.1 CheR family methyltransferase [Mesorhizobium sp. BAC0120]
MATKKPSKGRKAGTADSGETPQVEQPPSGAGNPLLVGLCASSTATSGLERYLASAKALPEVASVVILQYREARDDEQLMSRLAAAWGLPLHTISNGLTVEPGNLYLAPSDVTVSLDNGRFKTKRSGEQPGQRASIDSFLISLASEYSEHAVGIIFSETGSDGTLGVAALKEHGGLTLAEPPAPGTGEGLQNHLGKDAASIADFVLPVEDMATRIAAHIKSIERSRNAQNFDQLVAQLTPQLTRVATVLRNRTGHDFHGYKRNTFLRRVQRRIQVTQTETIEHYLEFLRTDPEEPQHLFNDLLIGVTQFFRDPKEFEFLETEVLPKLFEKKGAGDQLRIWVLGCATGEEAYSIAILLREQMARLDSVPHVQIFATDIDGKALAQARIGRYAESAIRNVSPERIARWFVKEGETYCVVKELREMCIFSQHNIIKDAPFSRLDMISCRNLLIYLNAELQDRVIPLFHFALRPGGVLFLGNSENVTRQSKLFTQIDRRFRIFRQVEGLVRVLPEFPLTATADRRPVETPGVPRPPFGSAAALSKQAERILERYAPAYMIIDESHEILHFSGRTGRFIDPPTGMASLNVLNLIHRDLRMDVRAALHKVETEKTPVQVRGLTVGQNGHSIVVTLTVEPIEPAPGQPMRYALILQDGYSTADGSDAVASMHSPPSGVRDDHVNRLEVELQHTRDRLQATIEELESTNEELKASNEEYQSVNEELQSSNEELETSKEELQSLNEELQTVNGELAHRVEELGRANSDLKNLLESTQIATVFLDNDLRIKTFTPAMTDLFHLVETDLGRPISHIAARINYADLESDLRKVLRTLGTIERETRNIENGARYLTRVLPYRSIDNVIEGVVLTFLDVTPIVRAEERLRESESRLRSVVEGIPQLVWRASDGGEWSWSSPQWTSFTGQSEPAAAGRGWLEPIHPDDRKRVLEAWANAKEKGDLEVDLRLWSKNQGEYRNVHMRAIPVKDGSGQPIEWFGSVTDVHEMLQLQERQQILLAELQHRVRNTLGVIRSIARRSADTNETVEDYAAHLEGRINALARIQNALTRAPNAKVDLHALILDELAAQGGREDGQFNVSGPNVSLSGKAAETLSLAIHELATNAVKYGALSERGGTIEVRWATGQNGDEKELRIRWEEKLAAPLDAAPSLRGFGSELIEKVVPYDLKGRGKLRFGSDGLLSLIEVPLSDQVRVGGPELDSMEGSND